jgi:hypothetical protein
VRLSIEQIIADNAKMERFICERIPAEGVKIDLGNGASADLFPFWDDRFGWTLLLETDEPEWVDLRVVYDHFRRQEMTTREWMEQIESEMARARVRTLESEVEVLRDGLDKGTGTGDGHVPDRRLITPRECREDRFQGKISLRQVYDLFYEGELEGFRVGRNVLLFDDSVDSFIDRNRNRKPPVEQESPENRPALESPTPKQRTRHRQPVSGFQFFHLPDGR